MKAPREQLALDLPVEPRFGVEDFLVSACNEEAYQRIEAWPRWPDPVLLLVGPPGCGKSHLGAIWAARARARSIAAASLGLADPPALAAAGAVLVENGQGVGAGEAALFHLLNLARESGCFALITANAPPDRWGLTTPDLVSRLRLAPLVEIGAPDEALIRAVLVKQFIDRQLVVDVGLIDYLALRIERSLGAARAIVAELDRAALAQGRRVTRAMAGEWLKEREAR